MSINHLVQSNPALTITILAQRLPLTAEQSVAPMASKGIILKLCGYSINRLSHIYKPNLDTFQIPVAMNADALSLVADILVRMEHSAKRNSFEMISTPTNHVFNQHADQVNVNY